MLGVELWSMGVAKDGFNHPVRAEGLVSMVRKRRITRSHRTTQL